MKLVAEGRNFVSYSFKRGEERPEKLPQNVPTGSKLKLCSLCKQRGVFEYT